VAQIARDAIARACAPPEPVLEEAL